MIYLNDSYTVTLAAVFVLSVLFCLFHILYFKDYIFDNIKHRRQKKHWEEQHIFFLKNMMLEDARWLSDLGLYREILERHEKAVSDDWYKIQFEGISSFRERLRNKDKVISSKEDKVVDVFADKMKQILRRKREEGNSGVDSLEWNETYGQAFYNLSEALASLDTKATRFKKSLEN